MTTEKMSVHSGFYSLLGFDMLWVLLVDGALFIVAYVMRKIFIAMQMHDFFDQQTPARLRIIGWTIIRVIYAACH